MIQLNSDSIKVKENGQWSSLASLTGPQGEKGETGATGSQGPQGIPGVPGYPTISAGDAGKVLTVNSNEDAVEWAETVAGIEVWDVTNRLDSYLTVDELAKVNEIPNGYRLFLEYNGIFFIQDEY